MKVILVSYSGTSASILKDRMSAWAHANLIESEILISPLSGLDEGTEDADIVLVGPQVRCALASVRERVPGHIPVLAVDTRDFGMAKGDRVMQEAIAEIRRYKDQLI
ncbi:MAG: PTS sugar transporter subunit IIB [Lachnospiraceae bacterium]|nr:PTS sugar transporter subunit IIB [Lachnospiraceae bacterium]